MVRKVFVFIIGFSLILPVLLALCSETIWFVAIMTVYVLILYHSPKFSPIIRKFWIKFWKTTMELNRAIEVRLLKYVD